MDFRVVHPVPLTVADVMAEFHVLDALGRRERGGAECPAGLAAAGGDDQPCGEVEASLKRDTAPDVCPVFFTARVLDVAADRLQRNLQALEVRVAQMGVFGYVCYRHRRLTDSREVACRTIRGSTDMVLGFDCGNIVITSLLGGLVTWTRGGAPAPARCPARGAGRPAR